jgi:hypothetical protein
MDFIYGIMWLGLALLFFAGVYIWRQDDNLGRSLAFFTLLPGAIVLGVGIMVWCVHWFFSLL